MNHPTRHARIGRRLGAALLASTSLVATALVLVIADLAAGLILRVSAPEPQGTEVAGDTVSQTLARLDLNPAPVIADSDLLWSNEPGARKTQAVNPRPLGSEPPWTAEINSEGFRGPERARTDAVFRIVCIGDSITFGFNVDQKDSFPEQLRELLGRRYPGRRFEVINAGVPGWSWLQGLRFLELRGLELDPDLVIMGHGTNDQLFPARITDEERLVSLGGPWRRALRRTAHRLVSTNLYRLLGPSPVRDASKNSLQCEEQIAKRGMCRRVSLEQIEAGVERVVRLVSEAGAGLLLVNTDFMATPAVRASRAAAESKGALFEDLALLLREKARTDEDERAVRLGLATATRAGGESGEPRKVPASLVLRVVVPDPALRYGVIASTSFGGGGQIRAVLRDDGAEGDEKSGDSVFSATIAIPASAPSIEYRYFQERVAEFTPLPPVASTLGDRLLAVPGAGFGPVDVFAQNFLMAERAHPNRNGHAEIAARVLARIEELPVFRAAQ